MVLIFAHPECTVHTLTCCLNLSETKLDGHACISFHTSHKSLGGMMRFDIFWTEKLMFFEWPSRARHEIQCEGVKNKIDGWIENVPISENKIQEQFQTFDFKWFGSELFGVTLVHSLDHIEICKYRRRLYPLRRNCYALIPYGKAVLHLESHFCIIIKSVRLHWNALACVYLVSVRIVAGIYLYHLCRLSSTKPTDRVHVRTYMLKHMH